MTRHRRIWWTSVLALAMSAVSLAHAQSADGEVDTSVVVLPRTGTPASVRPIVIADVTPAPYTNVDQGATPPTPAPTSAPPPMPATTPAPPAGGPDPAAPPVVTTEDKDPRALTAFRAQLDPFGSWVDDEKYGTVWVPARAIVGESFAPYVSSGHWALDTGNNWVWVSDFSFGDVVFHYGRWVWSAYGWSWVPGYQYAPAWVTWRTPTSNYHYVGWAPAPPSYIWVGGYASAWSYPWSYYWVFCPSAFLFAPYPYAYIVTHPLYIRSIARYTRVYTPANPRLSSSPSLEAARVPRQVWPSERIAAAPRLADRAAVQGTLRPGAAARVNERALMPGRLDERALRTTPPRFAPPTRISTPPGRFDARHDALPPGRLVPPSRFDAPARPFLPSSSVRDASSFPGGGRFDTARPFTPTRFDAPGRATFPGRTYSPSGPTFQPQRFDSPSRGFSPSSPSFAPSHSFSPARSYSPPPTMHAPAAPRMSPPPMRSPR